MKKHSMIIRMFALVFSISLLAKTSGAFAQTDIPGGNVSGLWAKANSPYHVNGEITVPDSQTLSIEPGVAVIFTGHNRFNIQVRLLAIGTMRDTITFTAQNPDTGWYGLRFVGTPSANDTSKVVYCRLQYAQVAGVGGAIYIENFNKLVISNCLITKNQTSGDISSGGGGIGMFTSSPRIENNMISYNIADGGHGGGLYISSSNPYLKNNIISKNHATGGGGLMVLQGNPVFINNTITENMADSPGGVLCHGGAICNIACSPIYFNTVLYGNKTTTAIGDQAHLQSGAQPTFCFCTIEGGKNDFARDGAPKGSFSGTYISNIETDPLFISTASDNYHLSDNSPCIGAGGDSIQINTNWYRAPHSDNDGNVRPNPAGSKPDIGAFESPLGSPLTGIHEGLRELPNGIRLYHNYPNPFNPSTTIRFFVPFPGNVKLHVYDCLGREVSTLLDAELQPGEHSVSFDANGLSSGFYFYRLQTGDFLQCQKCVLLK
jgi:parallel beta-helix repeat protein